VLRAREPYCADSRRAAGAACGRRHAAAARVHERGGAARGAGRQPLRADARRRGALNYAAGAFLQRGVAAATTAVAAGSWPRLLPPPLRGVAAAAAPAWGCGCCRDAASRQVEVPAHSEAGSREEPIRSSAAPHLLSQRAAAPYACIPEAPPRCSTFPASLHLPATPAGVPCTAPPPLPPPSQVQYRMHPSLSSFPSTAFYGSALLNGVTAAQRPALEFPWPSPEHPMVFIDVQEGAEELAAGGSKANAAEARGTARVVAHLLAQGVAVGDIGVVCSASKLGAGQQWSWAGRCLAWRRATAAGLNAACLAGRRSCRGAGPWRRHWHMALGSAGMRALHTHLSRSYPGVGNGQRPHPCASTHNHPSQGDPLPCAAGAALPGAGAHRGRAVGGSRR
jgi:hypothetical protein